MNFRTQDSGVLIVPLWNWNLVGTLSYLGLDRSNRTFMELKSEQPCFIVKLKQF